MDAQSAGWLYRAGQESKVFTAAANKRICRTMWSNGIIWHLVVCIFAILHVLFQKQLNEMDLIHAPFLTMFPGISALLHQVCWTFTRAQISSRATASSSEISASLPLLWKEQESQYLGKGRMNLDQNKTHHKTKMRHRLRRLPQSRLAPKVWPEKDCIRQSASYKKYMQLYHLKSSKKWS